MLSPFRYGRYFFVEGVRHVFHIHKDIVYDNVRTLDDTHANAYIAEKIKSGEPFLACRFGSGEMRAFLKTLEVRMHVRLEIPEQNMDSMCINAGFFPREQRTVMRFGRLMEDVCREVDMLAIWGTLPMENYVIDTFTPQAKLCYLSGLEPFFADEPWTKALAGKKVLVIHPFDETIRAQYEKRQQLFADKDMMPEFELKTLKAVQTIAGEKDPRFADWFEALDYMYEEAMKTDFDVAIIGCGAYGFPLAAKLKRAGKQAIHMGGATQLLFGIKGKRWEEKEEYKPIINEHWRRPAESETPAGAKKIEGSCYW